MGLGVTMHNWAGKLHMSPTGFVILLIVGVSLAALLTGFVLFVLIRLCILRRKRNRKYTALDSELNLNNAFDHLLDPMDEVAEVGQLNFGLHFDNKRNLLMVNCKSVLNLPSSSFEIIDPYVTITLNSIKPKRSAVSGKQQDERAKLTPKKTATSSSSATHHHQQQQQRHFATDADEEDEEEDFNEMADKKKNKLKMQTFRTKTKQDTINPAFNEVFKFQVSSIRDNMLKFVVYDEDEEKDRPIAFREVDLRKLDTNLFYNRLFEFTANLRESVSLRSSNFGEVCLIFNLLWNKKLLQVTVLEAKELLFSDWRKKPTNAKHTWITVSFYYKRKLLKTCRTSKQGGIPNPYFDDLMKFQFDPAKKQFYRIVVRVFFLAQSGITYRIGGFEISQMSREALNLHQFQMLINTPRRSQIAWYVIKRHLGFDAKKR